MCTRDDSPKLFRRNEWSRNPDQIEGSLIVKICSILLAQLNPVL
jgi:hypothetical protein